RLPHALHPTHLRDLLHLFAGVECGAQLHPGASLPRDESHPHRVGGQVGVRLPVRVGEPVDELQRVRRLDRRHPPVAVVLVTLRPGHVVGDVAARGQVVLLHGGGVGRRSPPAFQLARVGPQLPHPLHRGVELRGQGQGQPVEVLLDTGDCHLRSPPLGLSPLRGPGNSSDIRSTRPRQTASRWSSACRARRTASRSVRTSCSLPRRCLVTRPARSSTATCFCTAAKLMGYASASFETESSPATERRRMSRRVASASAWNRSSSACWLAAGWLGLSTTIWLYVSLVRPRASSRTAPAGAPRWPGRWPGDPDPAARAARAGTIPPRRRYRGDKSLDFERT